MPYDKKLLKRDAAGAIIPQFWNEAIDDYEPLQGTLGANYAQTQVLVAAEPFSGSSSMTKQFAKPMTSFVISNDGNGDLTFTINGETWKVYAGAVFEEEFAPFTVVTVTTAVPFQAYAKYPASRIIYVPPVDTTTPDNVKNLTAANITTSGTTLTWTASASADVQSYDVYNGTSYIANVTSTTCIVTGLAANTTYIFTVKARDTSGNLSTGASISVKTKK